ncbi:hypothetical protein VT84_14960 [Gemmata sp. SH-PL17]|uniref:hypothetical protein n=1 Tax=Gemmata sp. SH-PL17 TaxID=1630693 RepID=UPI00078C6CBD|nr:hypothetical protein [Gemmata sp. SH-PL17]AMV25695.1 hypothetical protein VT84_14960 [Gemmata sp. SH-PL17]
MSDAKFEEWRELFGKAIDAPEVVTFLAKYPEHKIDKPSDGRQHVVAKKHGLELVFGLPDGSHAGGGSARQRVLITAFLNSEAVPKFKSFADLPLGLTFSDGHDELTAKLGAPERVWTADGGAVRSARWRVGDLLLDADYRADQSGTRVFTLMIPTVVKS